MTAAKRYFQKSQKPCAKSANHKNMEYCPKQKLLNRQEGFEEIFFPFTESKFQVFPSIILWAE